MRCGLSAPAKRSVENVDSEKIMGFGEGVGTLGQ